MTAETLRDAFLASRNLTSASTRAELDALIQAVRAEEAAKGLTVEALAAALHRVGIESSNWYCGRADHQREHGVEPGDADWTARDEDKHRIESERLFAALTPTPPPPAATVVMPDGASFAWHAEPHGKDALCYGCRHHIGWHMQQCGCKEAPWCVPHPADEAHQWASLCRLPHEHVATPPPPAATVERCAVVYPFGPACPWTEPDHRWLAHPFAPAPEPK